LTNVDSAPDGCQPTDQLTKSTN